MQATKQTVVPDQAGVRWAPSENCNERPPGVQVESVVIHFTDLPLRETLELLSRPGHPASTHYVIDRDGALYQMVPEHLRAWHSGVSRYAGRDDVNDFSIGVDLVFEPELHDRYEEVQYQVLLDLIDGIRTRHTIDPALVTGHEDVALPPGRKVDPGPCFDWARIRGHLSEQK